MKTKPDRRLIFESSVFFVLGFSVVFSLLGVLLQTALSSVSYSAKIWLARLGGAIIVFFGLYLLGLFKLSFLEREHKLKVKPFKSPRLTSFVFGAAFALGWTPCVGAVLGAILTLAISSPSSAFVMLFSYSLGLGLPFLVIGAFTDKAQRFFLTRAEQYEKWVGRLNKLFGVILVLVGLLVFTDNLSRLANFGPAVDLLIAIDANIDFGTSLNVGVAFLAGLVSFLSPCVLPLMPAFFSYLASIGSRGKEDV